MMEIRRWLGSNSGGDGERDAVVGNTQAQNALSLTALSRD